MAQQKVQTCCQLFSLHRALACCVPSQKALVHGRCVARPVGLAFTESCLAVWCAQLLRRMSSEALAVNHNEVQNVPPSLYEKNKITFDLPKRRCFQIFVRLVSQFW